MYIYVDESGDLGWTFDPPYGHRGSSRFLTIFAVIVPASKCHLIDRVVRDMYRASRWTTVKERKWIDASEPSRLHFARQAASLLCRHTDISYHAAVVYKPNVALHLRAEPHILYNYMLKLILVGELREHTEVHLVPDNRSVKVASGNSLHEYLQSALWFEAESRTVLRTTASDSAHCRGLQFADFMAGAVNAYFEHEKRQYLETEGLEVAIRKLYFPG